MNAAVVFGIEQSGVANVFLALFDDGYTVPCALVLIHGNIRLLHQFAERLSVARIDGNADAGRYHNFVTINNVGVAKAPADFRDECSRIIQIIGFRQHDDELISTVTTGGVGAADPLGQTQCHCLQKLVAAGVSKFVINVLEVVEIKQ